MARGVEDAANEQGYYVVLCNTDESQEKLDQYVNVMLQKRVDGFFSPRWKSTQHDSDDCSPGCAVGYP